MHVNLNKKVLIGLFIGVLILVIITLIVIRFRSRSKFAYPPASSDTQGATMSTALTTCQDTFNRTMIPVYLMSAGPTKDTDTANAEKTLATCISTAVSTYTRDKCPEISAANIGTKPSDPTKAGYYDTYTTTDLPAIQVGYYTVLSSPATSFTRGGTTPSNDMVIAARKADLAGATRKYIAKVCPTFYAPADGTTDTNTALYSNWQSFTAAPAAGSTAEGFYGTNVTNANIITWADYAATTKLSTSSPPVTVASGASSFVVTLENVTGLVANSDFVQFTYQTYTPSSGALVTSAPVLGKITTISGMDATIAFYSYPSGSTAAAAMNAPSALIIPIGTTFAKGLVTSTLASAEKWWKLTGSTPNWKNARDYGPGSYPVPSWAT